MRDDAHTPDAMDAERLVSMPRGEAKDRLRLTDAQYDRMMRDVEPVIGARNNRESQEGIAIPAVVVRPDRKNIADISDRRR